MSKLQQFGGKILNNVNIAYMLLVDKYKKTTLEEVNKR